MAKVKAVQATTASAVHLVSVCHIASILADQGARSMGAYSDGDVCIVTRSEGELRVIGTVDAMPGVAEQFEPVDWETWNGEGDLPAQILLE